MTTYTSTTDLAAAARLLRDAAGPIVVITHAKPDGDAMGSVVALTAALRALGKEVHAVLAPPVPDALRRLPGSDLTSIYSDAAPPPDDAALYAVLDTGAYVQLGPLRPLIERRLDRTLIIDHHLSGDVPAAHRVIDGAAAATAEMIAELLLGHLLPPGQTGDGRDHGPWRTVIPTALYTGIASDTGWFRFSNTTARTHRLAAQLKDLGVDHAALYARLEQTDRPERLRLMERALRSVEFLAGGRAALMVLRQRDFAETGAVEAETERLIDLPQSVTAVQAVALVTERAPRDGTPVTAISFRSKPGPEAVNVAEVAGQFGGGGHARAAGAKLDAPIDEAVGRVRAALEAAVR